MNKTKAPAAVVGVYVTPAMVEAVVVRPEEMGSRIVHRIVRQRVRPGELVTAETMEMAVPGLKSHEESDFTLEIGGRNGGGASTFLPSEFGAKGKKKGPGAPSGTGPFVRQLEEILAECEKQGYPHPQIAFCTGPPDVDTQELRLPGAASSISSLKGSASKGTSSGGATALSKEERQRLFKQLAEKREGGVDEEQVGLLPMTEEGATRRYLALVPEPGEAVTATLKALAKQGRAQGFAARLLETEVSLYASLARRCVAATEKENTALVRVGSQNTLVLFLNGGRLKHFERLRSLTSYDSPETICSRVMLQQDEHKVGKVHHVLVSTEGSTRSLLDAFRSFYADAAIEPLQRALGELGIRLPDDPEETIKPTSIPAIAVALRLVDGSPLQADLATGVNLLPKKLLRSRQRRPAFAWHTALMIVLLFGATLFFTWRYAAQQTEISHRRAELAANPVEMPDVNAQELRQRVDSLSAAHLRYTHALHILDSLLIGSDQWSRMLERVSRSTRDVSGLWIENWQAQGPSIRLKGNALSRGRAAIFARRLNAQIDQVDFLDVGDVRVYPFSMVVPVPAEMPFVAEYLRDVALGHIQLSAAGEVIAADGSTLPLKEWIAREAAAEAPAERRSDQ